MPSSYFDRITRIEIRITDATGVVAGLNYAIGQEQADALYVGSPPPDFDMWSRREWEQRLERADALAKAIATDLAQKLVKACNPLWRKENL